MKNQTIKLRRGNSAAVQILPLVNGAEYKISGGEKVIFSVKESANRRAYLKLQKVLTSENYDNGEKLLLYFEPADTVNLVPGLYKYDCALASGNTFLTFIPPSDFFVENTITEPFSSCGGTLGIDENTHIAGEILYPREAGIAALTASDIDTLFCNGRW